MRICSLMIVSVIFLSVIISAELFSQEMPQIEMPEMPSMPTLDGSFYTPSFPSRINNKTKKAVAEETEKEKNETVLTNSVNPNTLLSSVLAGNNALTANDISSLYDSGLFSSLSSLDNTSSLTNYNTTP